jgi:hypothetical protein
MIIRTRVDVTPSDTEATAEASQGLWVGGAGNVDVRMADGARVTIQGVAAGTLLPDAVTHVFAAETTATLIQLCYATGR